MKKLKKQIRKMVKKITEVVKVTKEKAAKWFKAKKEKKEGKRKTTPYMHHTVKWCKEIHAYGEKFDIPIKASNFNAIKADVKERNNCAWLHGLRFLENAALEVLKYVVPIVVAFFIYCLGGQDNIYNFIKKLLAEGDAVIIEDIAIGIYICLFATLMITIYYLFKEIVSSLKRDKTNAIDNLTFELYEEIVKDGKFEYPRKSEKTIEKSK